MSTPKHFVAVFGGAVSGSEATFQLTQKGIEVVVFEQNALPYGKIEDGLPKWHAKLRDKEIGKINEKLNHPLVTYVPNTALGKDIQFDDLTTWGFSAILLAIGAWKDRPLPVPDVDQYIGNGLVYQNPFIYWYNHKHEPGFDQGQYTIEDGAAIVGGGLASLDCAKVIMFELVEKALTQRGIKTDLFALDRSIAKVLDKLGLTLEDLGIKGCTLYYRRRAIDMPLSPLPTDTEEQLKKARSVREKILNNYQSKYLFNFAPNRVPVDKISERGKLTGLVFLDTKIENGRAVPIPGTERIIHFPYVISSIGSIPELIPGIPAQGQTYHIEEHACCRIKGYDHVFALGNAVTGRGNIKESMIHGREVSQKVIERYLDMPEKGTDPVKQTVGVLVDDIQNASLSQETYISIKQRIEILQKKAGYHGNYKQWIEKHEPERLEDQLDVNH